jgi:ribosomal protein L11
MLQTIEKREDRSTEEEERSELLESKAKATEGRATSNKLEEGETNLKTVEDIGKRRMDQFDSFQS